MNVYIAFDIDTNFDYNIATKVYWRCIMEILLRLKLIAETNGGIITTSKAAEEGISRATLSVLATNKKIQRIANGQYILENDLQDELFSIGLRSDKIIFSHETALFLHGISDRTPFEHTITAPSGSTPSYAIKEQCKIYFVKPELFELGKTTLKTAFGNEVVAYDLERTICDIVRSRNKVGTETFLSALKLYAERPDKNLNRLNDYAKQLRISNVLRKYLEVLL